MKNFFRRAGNGIKNFFAKTFPGLGIEESEYDFRPNAKVAEEHKGKRRLIEDPTTGKFYWSNGEEPLPLTDEDKHYKPHSITEDFKKKGVRKMFSPSSEAEVYKHNRFVVDFPGIKEYLIRSFKKTGNNRAEMKVVLVHPFHAGNEEYDICQVLSEFKDKIEEAEARRVKMKDVTLKPLNSVGKTIKTISFEGVTLDYVEFFDNFTYDVDEIMIATLAFNYKKETLS